MSMLNLIGGTPPSGGDLPQQSLKFNPLDSQYLSWTPETAGDRKTWTWSGWVKRTHVASANSIFTIGASGSSYLQFRFETDGAILVAAEQSGTRIYLRTNPKYVDPTAWYHLCLTVDTTESVLADRVKLFVNGNEVTDLSHSTRPSQNYELLVNSVAQHFIGALSYGTTSIPFQGYMSNVHFIDGTAYGADAFGEFVDGCWKNKDFEGVHGTNGANLTFADDVVSEGFNTVTYRGNGGTQSISGLGLEPDFVWTKGRSARHHLLFDTIRGNGAYLLSASTNSEATDTNTLTTFDGDGFTIGSNQNINTNGEGFVAWCWDAGDDAPVTNTEGTITSTVKANPDYGFSIITFTGNGGSGQTFGHGLDSRPEFLIHKDRNTNSNNGSWNIWHKDAGDGDDYMYFSTAKSTGSAQIIPNGANLIEPKPNLVTSNQNGHNYITYAWHSVAGYSSIGSYTGTGSTVSVNCGFKAAWLLIKRTNTAGFSWVMLDNTRTTSGELDDFLLAENTIKETNNGTVRVLPTDTGFDVTGTATSINASGGEYIFMCFADTREAAFWKDVSGQGNHWTPTNLDYRHTVVDSPSNNFAVVNTSATLGTTPDGALTFNGAASFYGAFATIGTKGKAYYEASTTQMAAGSIAGFAVRGATNPNTGSYFTSVGFGGVYWNVVSSMYVNNVRTDNLGPITDNFLQFACDGETGKCWVGTNGTWWQNGDPETGANPTWTLDVSSGEGLVPAVCTGATGFDIRLNFGQESTHDGKYPEGEYTDSNGLGRFRFEPPEGFLSLCTQNMPEPTILDGSDHFSPYRYLGDGASTRSFTGLGFQPDVTWFKSINTNFSHRLFNSLTGFDDHVYPDRLDIAPWDGVTSYDADGFSVKTDATAGNILNTNGITYMNWAWKAGGTAVTNTNGTITSQVSANPDAGFSALTYVGNGTTGTVGHGLSGVELLLVKYLDGSENWSAWHKGIPITKYLRPNTDAAATTPTRQRWNSTEPTSTVFSVGEAIGDREVNQNNSNYLALCFNSVEGYQKVGTYIGNGNASGTYIDLGFKPRFWLMKSITAGSHWVIYDSEREDNPFDRQLLVNEANTEAASGRPVNFHSNGVQLKFSTYLNVSNHEYLYLAIGGTPEKYSTAF